MRDELVTIYDAIDSGQLPNQFDELLGPLWDKETNRFHIQETYILDFKETIPSKFSDAYGAGIVRLALAFHNSFGGIAVFGVEDRSLKVKGVSETFDIESFNRVLTDFCNINIECLAKTYSLQTDGCSKTLVALLVPRRGISEPVRILRDLGPYPKGKLWVRDRHEVLEAGVRHFANLFSERKNVPSDSESENRFPIHRSFPPSPATVKEFVNRGDLLSTLWSWFVLGDQPRLYLHGPGGSGKSTLAFEFARLLAGQGQSIRAKDGDRLDYVIFISGKETEFNPHTGDQQDFALRQFSTATEQYTQILYHSGFLNQAELETASEAKANLLLTELFSNFSGLIVLDDIDALSRRGLDTGEEFLFLKAVQASKRTRILYTLRFPPAHARSSSFAVPGLDPNEFFEFLDICCAQFNVSPPTAEMIPHIQRATNNLPLLIETIILLRRDCGNYRDALQTFDDRGGDEARRYLYQREYDRLASTAKSRQVLAGLLLIEEPISFAALTGLFQFSREQVREALSECNSVFLSTFENEVGETLYQLTPPSLPFIRRVSEQLKYFGELQTKVRHFRTEGKTATPEEAAVIVRMNALIRQRRYADIVHYAEELPRTVMENPKARSLLGQAFSELGGDHRQKARECFKHAEGLGYRDTFMMRRWFNMELSSGYGDVEAERVCRAVINDEKVSLRFKSEFWSKLGACYLARSNSLINFSREKGLEQLRQSIICYLEGLWIGANAKDLDLGGNLEWLERRLHQFIYAMRDDVEQFFTLLEALTERKHDVHNEGAKLIIRYLTRSPIPFNEQLQRRLKSLCARTISKISRSVRNIGDYPGYSIIVESLESFRDALR